MLKEKQKAPQKIQKTKEPEAPNLSGTPIEARWAFERGLEQGVLQVDTEASEQVDISIRKGHIAHVEEFVDERGELQYKWVGETSWPVFLGYPYEATQLPWKLRFIKESPAHQCGIYLRLDGEE